ncbi:hypothetical protein CUS37_13255 [Enterococcus faecium]|uniref:glycosyltransferase n=1 Tax=Enterococcus faecium TaxID=1352 RepID=UPI000CF344EA|nr:glycosyltransferase [Enterococcus faecium]PQG40572.1 hypothetical protein CUS37_13255 [Enterococcus faecium]
MIGFEVLHYETINETIQCVESILSNVINPVIVVVDNASSNNSGNELIEKFKSYDNVFVLINEKNLGFAKGNNIGYKFLREKFDLDFICCINNDTKLLNSSFEKKIETVYKETNFGVLAPEVILSDGSIQSFNPKLYSLNYYNKELEKWKKCITYKKYADEQGFLFKTINRFPKFMLKIRRIKQNLIKPYRSELKDVVLHGCFLVFSKDYINIFQEAFNSNTFMYREEELLFIRVKRAGLTTIYSNNIKILHLEDAATNFLFADRESKYSFQRKNQIQSLNILLEEINNIK